MERQLIIRQLLKHDPAWKVLPAFTFIGIVLSVLFLQGYRFLDRSEHFISNNIPVMLAIFLAIACNAHIRALPYHLSLPVSGRTLFRTRILAMTALILSTSAAASVTLALQGPAGRAAAMNLLEYASLLFLTIILLQFRRRNECQISPWSIFLPMSVLIFWMVIGGLVKLFIANTGWVVPLVCIPAALLLLLKIRKSIPEAYQLAVGKRSSAGKVTGTESTIASITASTSTSTSTNAPSWSVKMTAWWVLLRPIVTWKYLVAAALIFMSSALVSHMEALFLFLVWLFIQEWSRIYRPFPLRPGVVLSIFLLPLLVVSAAGHVIHGTLSPPPSHEAAIPSLNVTSSMNETLNYDVQPEHVRPMENDTIGSPMKSGLLYLSANISRFLTLSCFYALFFNFRLQRLSKRVWTGIYLSVLAAVLIAPLIIINFPDIGIVSRLRALPLHAALMLPDSIVLTGIAAAALPLLLFWLNIRLFRSTEDVTAGVEIWVK